MTKRYWLRVGIVLSSIFTILNIILLISVWRNQDGGLIFAVFNFPVVFLIDFIEEIFNFSFIVYPIVIILTAFVWFLIGAIIGWLYGKIKNRNKVIQ